MDDVILAIGLGLGALVVALLIGKGINDLATEGKSLNLHPCNAPGYGK